MVEHASAYAAGPSRKRRVSRTDSSTDALDETVPALSAEHDGPGKLETYIHALDEHINATIRHVSGRERHIPVPGTSNIPEWLDWTLEEYSGFFAALSRHSRLRPDMIASNCGIPESDVLVFLEALEDGLAELEYRSVRSASDGSNADVRRLRRKLKHQFQEGIAPAAREVPENWIQEEEALASKVAELVRQQNQVRDELKMARERRKQQRAVKRDAKNISDLGERRRYRADRLAELDRTWAQEDWGRLLDTTKFNRLDKLIREPSRRGHSQVLAKEHDGVSGEATHQTNGEQPTSTRKPDRHGRIAADNAAMKSLLAIDRADRTHEQRAELYKLRHRKRTRDRTRLSILKGQGMTDEDIEAKGGLDAAYLATIGRSIEDERVIPLRPRPDETPSSPVPQASDARQAREDTAFTTTSTASADSAATSDLRLLVPTQTLMADSLDIIDYRRLAQVVSGVDWTLAELRDIHNQLLAFLKKTVFRVVLLAESENMQIGSHERGLDASIVKRVITPPATSQVAEYLDHEDDPTVPGDDCHREDDIMNDVEHDTTDDEDDKLDVALNAFDDAADLVGQSACWTQAKWEGNDHTAWNRQAQEARSAYLSLLAEVGKARRHRHAIQRRSERFTSIYYRRDLGHRRAVNAVKSNALIEDSDSESVSLDV